MLDDIGQTLQEVLGDPQKMAELRMIAESLGLNPASQEVSEADVKSAAHDVSLPAPEPRQDALLQALLSYLTPARRGRLERALRVGRLSKIAGTALQNYGNLFEAGAL